MDASTFDRLARLMTGSPSRRAAVRLVAGLLMIGPWRGANNAPGALAKKKKRKKKCKGEKKKCGKTCISPTECCIDFDCPPGTGQICQNGGCACPVGEVTCDGICVDLETDAINCGACGNTCESGECVHGVCTCLVQNDCPASCACADRLQGGRICFFGGNNGQSCDNDDDCPARSACFSINFCSVPCLE